MAFVDQRLPTKIRANFSAEMVWQTDYQRNFGGYGSADGHWSSFLWAFTVSFITTDTDNFELMHFLAAVPRGRTNRFRFRYVDDYQATDSYKTGRPAANRTAPSTYQLVKKYNYGDQTITKNITRPIHNGVPDGTDTVKLYTAVSESTPVGSQTRILEGDATYPWSIDESTGIVTFSSTDPFDNSLVVLAEYDFDLPVRLASDTSNLQVSQKVIRQWRTLRLEEERE